MRGILKRFFKVILQSWSTLLCFELFYKTIGLAVIGPLLEHLFLKMPTASGFTVLGQENMAAALASPKVIALLLLVLVLVAAYVYFELVALVLYCDRNWRRERVPFRDLWKDTFRQWVRMFFPCNLPVILLILPALAFSALPLTSGALRAVKVPEFIVEFIRQKPSLAILYGLLLLVLNLASFRYLFGLPYAILQKERFASAWRKSRTLLAGRNWKAALVLALCFLAAAAVMTIFAAAVILLLFAYAEFTGGGEGMFRFLAAAWGRAGRLAASFLGPAVLAAVSVLVYHQFRGETPPAPAKAVPAVKGIANRALMVAFSIILLIFLSETSLGGAWALPDGKETQIVAHRAGAVFAPENTVAALEQAVKDGADMAEIDVQQTGDGVLLILHDPNFKRTTGVDLNIWDAEYGQVRELDAGILFSSKYEGEPIPTLEEMLRAAKGRIKLMIELKSTGHESGLVEQTVTEIRKEGMEDECAIASMDLSILQSARKLAPELQTVYISAILLTQEYDLDDVDGYSVETTSLTPAMAAEIHAQGKLLYVWTANSDANIQRILRSEADGLITDNPALARFYLEAGSSDLFLDELVHWLYRPFGE